MSDFFQGEQYLADVATSMGHDYVPGSQLPDLGSPADQSSSRVNARIDEARARIRELKGLPLIVPEDEAFVHRTPDDVAGMQEPEVAEWLLDSLEWIVGNPSPHATIEDVIDPRDTRDDK
jgi:hypothetical protein